MVHGSGPRPCPLMIVGDKIGWMEEKYGRVFVGPTGQELERHLDANDLPPRQEWFLTNLYRIYGGKEFEYGAADLERDEPYLLTELEEVCPELIVTLGRTASRYFLGDVDLDSVQGIPFYLPPQAKFNMLGASTVVLPITHPAAGLRNSEISPYVVQGFKQLAAYLAGQIEARILFDDPFVDKEQYVEIATKDDLERAFHGYAYGAAISLDTEGYPHAPWSLQFSSQPGLAYLIRASRRELLTRFVELASQGGRRLVFHSALHDLGMMRVMGIPWHGDFDDTMVMAYLLQLEPQGLKQSCLRHCNMQMDSYDDILGDMSNDLVRQYLTWLWDVESADYEDACHDELIRLQTTPYIDARGKEHSGRRIRRPPILPKSPLLKAVSRVLQSKEPRKLWLGQIEDVQVEGYHRMGPLPEATLDYVAPARAIHYGCRDADGTTRLLPEYSRRIDSLGLRAVYNLELSTYPLIDRMQHIGLKPDLEHFARLSTTLGGEIARLREDLATHTGRSGFNANSGDQVADYLFNTLNLQEMKLTRSGRGSTNDKILEALEHEHPEHPVIATIREYRETYKLKNTFTDRLKDHVNRWPYDGRIHATFRTTRVVTGRLAASDPNILAMPKHGKFAKEFRRGWICDDGHLMGSWDLSQIELRVAAHLSQDPVMLAIYRGERRNPDGSLIDLHAALAHRIFGVDPKLQDDSKHRLPAKCFHPDTEVLTKAGWKKILEIYPGEEIVQAFPRQDGQVRMEWVVPTQVFSQRHESGKLIHLKNEGIDIRVTPDHRMLVWRQDGDWDVVMPDEVPRAARWANAGILNDGHPKGDEKLLRLAVATQADGHFTPSGHIVWGFSKQRKIERLRQMLVVADVPFSEQTKHYATAPKPVTEFKISREHTRSIKRLLTDEKTLPWRWLLLRPAERMAVLDEAQFWDSYIRKGGRSYSFSSVPAQNAHVLQAMAAITGRKTRLVTTPRIHDLTVRDRATTEGGNASCTEMDYTEEVACLSVPSSFVLVRDGGIPLICGQSINFGYWMGQTAKGLQVELRKNGIESSESDAQLWLDEADALYVGAIAYKTAKIAEVEKYGYTRCMDGRIRYIGGIWSKDERVREEAERFAFSTPIQAGAQTVMKTNEAALWRDIICPLHRQGMWIEPLVQIHDDLVLEMQTDIIKDISQRMVRCMTESYKGLSVPIKTSSSAGLNWADMKEVI